MNKEDLEEIIMEHQYWLDWYTPQSGERADLSYVDLSGMCLGGVDLSHANFTGANLTGTNFEGAFLEGANFTDAILINTDFTNSTLCNAIIPKEATLCGIHQSLKLHLEYRKKQPARLC